VAAVGHVGCVSDPLLIADLAEGIGLPSAVTLPAALAFVVALRRRPALASTRESSFRLAATARHMGVMT
jgi:hypothetical protein